MNTQEKLNRLHELKTAYSKAMAERIAESEQALTPVKALLDAINAKWDNILADLTEQVAELEAEIKTDVLATGETVKGDKLMAVWNKGRVSWDGKLLDGMAKIIPQLSEARKVGEPTVAIREVK